MRPTLSCDAAHDHEQDHHEEQKCQQVGYVGLVVRALFGTRLPFLRIDRHRLDDVVDPATDPTCETVGPQAWDDGILNDELRYRVGKRSFEAISDLDAYLALVRRYDQQGASVFLFLSDLLVTPELIAIVLDRGSLQRLERNHNQLARGLGVEIG